MQKNASQMTPDEIVSEISELQESMKSASDRTFELAKALYSRVRREGANDNTPAYVNYSNAWMRFSGALTQGLQRASLPGKILKRTQEETLRREQEQLEKQKRDEERKLRKDAKAKAAQGIFGNDLMELYGEDMVPNADQ